MWRQLWIILLILNGMKKQVCGVRYAMICDDMPLALESNSFDALIEKVKIVAYEMLEANEKITDTVRLCFRAVHWEDIA